MIKHFDVHEEVIVKYPSVTLILIVGARGVGKTFSAKRFCINNFLSTGKKFIYVRRFQEDIKSSEIGTLFNDVFEHCPELVREICKKYNISNCEIIVKGSRFYLATEQDGKSITLDYIGRAVSVHKAERFKGSPYNDHNIILFDEFITKGGYVRADHEPELFTKIIETVFRAENSGYIIMAGNPDSNPEACPYLRGIPDFDYQKTQVNQVTTYDTITPTGKIIKDNVAFIKVVGSSENGETFLNHRTGGLFNSGESKMSYTGEVATDAFMRYELIQDDFIPKYHITMETAVMLQNGHHRALHIYYGLINQVTPACVILSHNKLKAPMELYSRYDELSYINSKNMVIWRAIYPHTFKELHQLRSLSEELRMIFSDSDYNATTYQNIILNSK